MCFEKNVLVFYMVTNYLTYETKNLDTATVST